MPGTGVARWAVLLLCAGLLAGTGAEAHRPSPLVRGTETGLALPRFASVKARVANLRRGPGLRYPIEWVYHRRHLPVLILREFGDWRLLRTPDGTRGWMHLALLSRRRSFIVVARSAVLRVEPRGGAKAIARLRHAVIGWLHGCTPGGWCEAEADGYHGFVRRAAIWGSDADSRTRAAPGDTGRRTVTGQTGSDGAQGATAAVAHRRNNRVRQASRSFTRRTTEDRTERIILLRIEIAPTVATSATVMAGLVPLLSGIGHWNPRTDWPDDGAGIGSGGGDAVHRGTCVA